MSDTSTQRLEPILDTGPVPFEEPRQEKRLEAVLPPPAPPVVEHEPLPAPDPTPAPDTLSVAAPASGEQLSRIEDKAARIEEKFARQEATAQRVMDRFDVAVARMNEVALQSDLAAVRGEVGAIARRVRGLPGFSGLVVTAIVTSALTALLMVAVLRYAPGLLAR